MTGTSLLLPLSCDGSSNGKSDKGQNPEAAPAMTCAYKLKTMDEELLRAGREQTLKGQDFLSLLDHSRHCLE
ncbi:hypothetical protein [Oligoflexus tunisiensis]|uniref:hypothetical protein n=1 Tax=Oligoflexus tunisiensis TaxID=708132 RepID=UPI001C4024AB|nr:hypothetical protein [Oligoflexus tunisiensis]